MADTLTQAEADRLISMLKHSLMEFIQIPGKRQNIEFDVIGESKKDRFAIYIFRGNIKGNKIHFNARIKANGITLLELHLNPTTIHSNPDGTKITGSHWHIYREGYGHSYAFPAEDITSDDFVENTIKFLKRFHVVDSNLHIGYQEEF